MEFPSHLKYTKEHEWVSVEGNVATVGITAFAAGELGDVVFVDIDPKIGSIDQDGKLGTIEAVKTVSDMFAPVSGTVLEVNPNLGDAPETVNADPYGAGWMVKIEMANPGELDSLLDAAAYAALIGE